MKSRTGKALRNTVFQLLLELVTAGCGLILPRLILSHFGSTYNGITQSISQFISCIALLKSGIGSVTRASLYKPLAEQNSYAISEVVNATERFMRRIAAIFCIFVLVFGAIYPFIIDESLSWGFVFSLVIILSISTAAQYFFGLTYQMLIEADQNNYIISIVSIVSTLVNTLIAAVLIELGYSIHVVKLGSAIIFVVPPIFYMLFARRKYGVDKTVPANEKLISQRWDAFAHQLANFINNNTDIMVTTIFLGVKEVSVYAVYNMIVNNMQKVVNSFSSGMTAAFGNMIAKKELNTLKERFNQFEAAMYGICALLFTTTVSLYIPFIKIYTRGISDVNYSRQSLASFFCLAAFFSCIKLVYENAIFAAGYFKKTKVGAYSEAIINIVTSVFLVRKIGLSGILIGTIVGGLFRTVYNNYIASRYVLSRNPIRLVYAMIYTICCSVITWEMSHFLPYYRINGYLDWGLMAIYTFTLNLIICVGLGFLFFYTDYKALIVQIKAKFLRT